MSGGRELAVVAGTGRIALEVGQALLVRGLDVTFAGGDERRLGALEARVRRAAGRLDAPGEPSFALETRCGARGAGLLVECGAEDLGRKRSAVAALRPVLGDEGLLATTSSSILPDEVDPEAVGLHVLSPLELTGLVELVLPPGCPPARRARALELAGRLGLRALEQGPGSAFALNRLLLPLQAECFRALEAGLAPAAVDEASRSRLLAAGQLSVMDAVGLDVLAPAVARYLGRLTAEHAALYEPLARGLAALVGEGRRGRKGRSGLRCGPPPALARRGARYERPVGLAATLELVFVSSCRRALAAGLLSPADLDLALGSVFGAEEPLAEAVARIGPARLARTLESLYLGTGLGYFVPPERADRPARAPF